MELVGLSSRNTVNIFIALSLVPKNRQKWIQRTPETKQCKYHIIYVFSHRHMILNDINMISSVHVSPSRC